MTLQNGHFRQENGNAGKNAGIENDPDSEWQADPFRRPNQKRAGRRTLIGVEDLAPIVVNHQDKRYRYRERSPPAQRGGLHGGFDKPNYLLLTRLLVNFFVQFNPGAVFGAGVFHPGCDSEADQEFFFFGFLSSLLTDAP